AVIPERNPSPAWPATVVRSRLARAAGLGCERAVQRTESAHGAREMVAAFAARLSSRSRSEAERPPRRLLPDWRKAALFRPPELEFVAVPTPHRPVFRMEERRRRLIAQ